MGINWGREDLMDTFVTLFENDELSHGYVFVGSWGVGKFSFALSLASYNEKKTFEKVDSFSETIVLDGDIGIDAIREMERFLHTSPLEGMYRIGIIKDIERATREAQHACLKLVEDAPQKASLFITAQSIDALIPPLQSRLQQVYIPRLSKKQILDFANKNGIIVSDDDVLYARGSIGRLMYTQRSLCEEEREIDKLLSRLFERGCIERERKHIAETIYTFIEKEKKVSMKFFVERMLYYMQSHREKIGDVGSGMLSVLSILLTPSSYKRIHIKHILWMIP